MKLIRFRIVLIGCALSVFSSCQDSKIQGELPVLANEISTNIEFSYETNHIIPTGSPFSLAPSATGTTAFLVAISPSLPSGLSLDNFTGVISGTPTAASSPTTYNLTIQKGSERLQRSFNLIVDATPPTSMVITDGTNQTETTSLSFSWTSSSDPETGISYYEYALGTSFGGTDVINWTRTENTSVTLNELTLSNGSSYYVSVRATNAAGLRTTSRADGIYVGQGTEEGVWLASQSYSDGSPDQTYGAKFCTENTCTDVGPFYVGWSFPQAAKTISNNYLFVQPDGAGDPTHLCTISGCTANPGLKRFSSYVGGNVYYGEGHFCNILTSTCQAIPSFSTYYDYVQKSLGGIWAYDHQWNRVFLNPTTVTAHSISIMNLVLWTHPLASDVWGYRYVSPNIELYRCQSSGTCNLLKSFSGEGSNVSGFLNYSGEGAWSTPAWGQQGNIRYCSTSDCTTIASVTYAGSPVKNSQSDGFWITTDGATKLQYCNTTSCAIIFTGTNLNVRGNDRGDSGASNKVFLTRSGTNDILVCSTSACNSIHTFSGAFSVWAIDNSSFGAWAARAGSFVYCDENSCTDISSGLSMTIQWGNYRAASSSSSLYLINSSNQFIKCSKNSCNLIQNIGAPLGYSWGIWMAN